jgi:perosamine synthetase
MVDKQAITTIGTNPGGRDGGAVDVGVSRLTARARSNDTMNGGQVISQVDLFIDERERRLVDTCLQERWLTEGPRARAFQEAIRARVGARHVMFAPNGTLGLYLALLGLDLPRGSEILIPTFTFYGSAAAAVFAGLKPVFVDADPRTFNATGAAFEAAVGRHTRAIMPVHVYGQACDMIGIMEVARRHSLKVVEDAAQAFTVTYHGKPAGTYGDIGVFSLFSDKVITTGEGGILTTDSDELAARLRLIRNQGRESSGTFIHPELGMNFRITDLQAAIGLMQLEKLPSILSERSRKWELYKDQLDGVGDIEFMQVDPASTLVPFRFPILTSARDGLAAALEGSEIQMRGFFYPMHLQPKLRAEPPQHLPVAEDIHRRGLCLPIHHHLTDSQIERITSVIRSFFRG